MRKKLGIFLLLCIFVGKLAAQSKDEKAIREVMRLQEDAWNKGDLDSFMKGYWNSPDLVFIGSKGVSKGWQTTLDNYRQSYNTPQAMGKLAFSILKIELEGKNTAWLIGKWSLQREKDNPNGHFLLVWRKIQGKWYIVADHSS